MRSFVSLASVSVGVLSVACGRESTAPPRLSLPLTDRIVFEVIEQDRPGGIVIMKTDGTDRRRLTGRETVDVCPALSPDGNWLAFLQKPTSSDILAPWKMILARADGTDPRVLGATRKGNYDCPVWSRGSRLVAYRSPTEPLVGYVPSVLISTYDTSGKLVSQVEVGSATYLRFSPDEARFLWVTYNPRSSSPDVRLESVMLDGSDWKRVVGAGFGDWSPTGQEIVFSTCGSFCANPLPPVTCAAICVTSDSGATWRDLVDYGNGPLYSPDGLSVAFTCNSDLCIVPSQGGAVTSMPVGDTPTWLAWRLDGAAIGFICGYSVCIADLRTKTIRRTTDAKTTAIHFSLSPASAH